MLIEYYVKQTKDVPVPPYSWRGTDHRVGDGMKFMFDGKLSAVITTKTIVFNRDIESRIAYKYFNVPEINLIESDLCYTSDRNEKRIISEWKMCLEANVIDLWKQTVARKLSADNDNLTNT